MGTMCLAGMKLKGMKQMFTSQAPCPKPSSLCATPTTQLGTTWETTVEAEQPSKKIKVYPKIKEDPYTTLPKDDNVLMKEEIPFDDSDPLAASGVPQNNEIEK
ncbi:hypothetical protein B296_00030074 [Ensete ventricosum]|uniref:Uncharacterized protein n=1 Tax=Ensete ventricosum TaxID=4639 RepID=A0A426YMM9_ENSVE|nr:hypothetical protein B296_00030074 [Ensete ventricosum]